MLKKLLTGEGRIGRLEFIWNFALYYLVVYCCVVYILPQSPLFAFVLLVIFVWIRLSQGARRCHDFGESGWMQLLPLFPIFMMLKQGHGIRNEYGYPPDYEKAKTEPEEKPKPEIDSTIDDLIKEIGKRQEDDDIKYNY